MMGQKKKEELRLLVSPEVKNIAIALIDEKPFLIKLSDIRLIDSKTIESISMYPSKSKEFMEVQNLYSDYAKNVECVFNIKLKENTCLPDEFNKVIKEQKKKE